MVKMTNCILYIFNHDKRETFTELWKIMINHCFNLLCLWRFVRRPRIAHQGLSIRSSESGWTGGWGRGQGWPFHPAARTRVDLDPRQTLHLHQAGSSSEDQIRSWKGFAWRACFWSEVEPRLGVLELEAQRCFSASLSSSFPSPMQKS